MSVCKCKMCGGTLEIQGNQSIAVCDYCGTKQTIPKIDDDHRANLYDRANHFRRGNEFDKAAGMYEQILSQDSMDAEAYWGLVLCKYGIEYVEDPTTHKRIPTVNRAQYTSIYVDENYKSAIHYADSLQKELFEEEAKSIDAIQKGILEISSKEEPFDIFICYKESDEAGNRTKDSVYAQDIYYQLVEKGYKVFFSRLTLESKLGQQYEPYIFAALNSAKVMLVVGSKPEYFNAVWVKNEWSRFLKIVQNDRSRLIIPVYKDMDPYDMPEALSYYQSQDMSKIGFVQDLIHGIEKVVQPANQIKILKDNNSQTASDSNEQAMIKRAFMLIEEEDWNKADSICEQVLNSNPENAQAYLAKLMIEYKIHSREDLKDCTQKFEDNTNYQKALRFGDTELSSFLRESRENAKIKICEQKYAKGKEAMETANNSGPSTTEKAYREAENIFLQISGFKDSDSLAEQCRTKAEESKRYAIYISAKQLMTGNDINNYEKAINLFCRISGFKDADEQITTCRHKIQDIKDIQEKEKQEYERKEVQLEEARKRRKKIIIIIIVIAVVVQILATIVPLIIVNSYASVTSVL